MFTANVGHVTLQVKVALFHCDAASM